MNLFCEIAIMKLFDVVDHELQYPAILFVCMEAFWASIFASWTCYAALTGLGE